MRTMLLKKNKFAMLFVTVCLSLSTLCANAQTVPDVITFTWKGSTSVEKSLGITAASGKTFSINWGNGTTNYTGTGTQLAYSQTAAYGDYDEYTVTITADADSVFTGLDLVWKEVTSLDVSGAPALTELHCSANSLSTLDVSNNTVLTYLSCYDNSLNTLDVSNNTALTYLSCTANFLSTLDVSNCTVLTYLSCFSNSLETLDVSGCTALTSLDCSANSLETLDVSECTALTYLSCYNNSLSTLDVSNNTALTYLSCSANSLETLDVSDCTAFTELRCYNNSLSTLDVSDCTVLTYLDCSSNSLETLDVSGCTALTSLDCSANSLETLDVSDCTALTYLSCFSNSLETLDVSDCTALTELRCFNNSLSTLELSNNTALIYLDCQANALPLVDLKALSEIASISVDDKYLGQQTLPLVAADSNTAITIDSVFNGINTVFDVTLNGVAALENTDYTITDGDITFLTTGAFKVSITNSALISNSAKPAEVIARFSVGASDATLATLAVSSGMLSPAFDPATMNYAVNVGSPTTSLIITATATDANATVAGAGVKSLNVGDNVFDIVVTAENGNEKTYTVTVMRETAPVSPVLSSDATLSALWVSEGTLTPAFSASVTDYRIIVAHTVEAVEIDASVNDANAWLSGTGVKILSEGENAFTIEVTAEDGTTKTYTVVITREATPVGIEKIDKDAIQVYPNPVTDNFRVRGITEPAVVSVVSLQGTILLQQKVEADENIYIGNLASGVYLIKVDGKTLKVLKK